MAMPRVTGIVRATSGIAALVGMNAPSIAVMIVNASSTVVLTIASS